MEIFNIIFGFMWLFSMTSAFFVGMVFGTAAAAKRQQALISGASEAVKTVIDKLKGGG